MPYMHTRLARIIHDNTGRLNRLVTEVLELGRRDRAQPELPALAGISFRVPRGVGLA
jgi:hypothetical protein